MTLKEFQQEAKDIQYWFNAAWDWHIVNNKPLGKSGPSLTRCIYRSSDGTCKCAVGAGLPDEFYKRDFEGNDAWGVLHGLEFNLVMGTGEFTELSTLLLELQQAHDGATSSTIRQAYETFANTYNLTIPSYIIPEGLKKGDYVLAMRWQDGDNHDPWFIGFYDYFNTVNNKHYVTGSDVEKPFGGYRRVKKISQARGEFILNHKYYVEMWDKSLLWWSRVKMKGFKP